MKKTIFILLAGIMLVGCAPNCSKYKSVACKYNINDMFSMIENEKKFLFDNGLDTIYFIDSCFAYLSNYRVKLVSILKEEGLPVNFDKGFLIEDFFVYKIGIRKSLAKDYPYDYRAVVYFENSKCKTFLDIDISKDLKKYHVDRIRVNTERDTTFQNWLSKKTELDRQNLKNGVVMKEEDQYDIVSKLAGDEKFCRVVINYFWNGFYGISEKPMPEERKKAWRTMERISDLMYLTGNGCSF